MQIGYMEYPESLCYCVTFSVPFGGVHYKRGYAHFMEHMTCKTFLEKSQKNQKLKNAPISLVAYTLSHFTVYTFSIDLDNMNTWVNLFTDTILKSTFSEDNFLIEKNIILNESILPNCNNRIVGAERDILSIQYQDFKKCMRIYNKLPWCGFISGPIYQKHEQIALNNKINSVDDFRIEYNDHKLYSYILKIKINSIFDIDYPKHLILRSLLLGNLQDPFSLMVETNIGSIFYIFNNIILKSKKRLISFTSSNSFESSIVYIDSNLNLKNKEDRSYLSDLKKFIWESDIIDIHITHVKIRLMNIMADPSQMSIFSSTIMNIYNFQGLTCPFPKIILETWISEINKLGHNNIASFLQSNLIEKLASIDCYKGEVN